METQQQRSRHSAWIFWIGLSFTIALTFGLAGIIIWLVVTQNLAQLTVIVGLIASIVAIVSTPLIFYFTIFHKPDKSETLIFSQKDEMETSQTNPSGTIWNVPSILNLEFTRHEATIDTHEAIKLFQQMMQPDSPIRILRLYGDGKMGKSHLLTKVFPALLQQEFQAPSAFVDLSRPTQTIPNILNQISIQLDEEKFKGFNKADKRWSNRPKMEVNGLTKVEIFTKDNAEGIHHRIRYLTAEFKKDLDKLNLPLVALLFDHFDHNQTPEELRDWLMEMLLIHLSPLSHLRIVIAGRALPEAHVSYSKLCRDFHLRPVKDVKAFIEYCQSTYPGLCSEREIRLLAGLYHYTPGLVAEALPNVAEILPKFAP